MKDTLLITDNSTLPVSLQQINNHLKTNITTSGQQYNYIVALLKAVTKYGETYTGLDFLNKTYRTFFNSWYEDARQERARNNPYSEIFFELPKKPISSITMLKYLLNGVLQTVVSTNYYTTQGKYNSKIVFKTTFDYPVTDEQMQSIQVEYVAGMADGTTIVLPDDIQLAILQHLARVWAQRGDCSECEGTPNTTSLNQLVVSNLPTETKQIYDSLRVIDIEL